MSINLNLSAVSETNSEQNTSQDRSRFVDPNCRAPRYLQHSVKPLHPI